MNGRMLKTSLLSFGLVGLLGGSAQAADVFGGQTFCEFHESYIKSVTAPYADPASAMEELEKGFAAKYVSGLRSGELAHPSVAQLTVPMGKQGGQVVVSYNPALDTLSVGGDLSASIGTLQLNRASQSGLRLDMVGSGEFVIDSSLSQAGLSELYVFTYGEDVSLTMKGSATCTMVDGGREQSTGSLKVDASEIGDPSIACAGSTIYGTSGGNFLGGTDCDDNIFGYAGNDSIRGFGGSDGLYGNEDNDGLDPGNYTYQGDIGYGGKGDDSISNNSFGTMRCFGDEGIDRYAYGCYTKSSCESTF